MKRFVLFALTFALSVLLSSPADAAARRKPKRPTWARGCHNEVLKKGYENYMSARVLTAMIAVERLERERGYWGPPITSSDIKEEVAKMLEMPDDGTTSYVLNSLIYPLHEKGFLYIPRDMRWERSLVIESHFNGTWSSRANLKTFWEIYARSCDERGKNIVDLRDLPQGPMAAPPLELSDYLILSIFFRGEHLGSTEVYDVLKDEISYYKVFFPTNTPTAILPRLRHLTSMGWLQNEAPDYNRVRNGGSFYKFSITSEGRQAFRDTETFYLGLVDFYLPVLRTMKAARTHFPD